MSKSCSASQDVSPGFTMIELKVKRTSFPKTIFARETIVCGRSSFSKALKTPSASLDFTLLESPPTERSSSSEIVNTERAAPVR